MNLGDGAKLAVCRPVTGDHVAVVSQNRKLLVFALAELPEMARGKGVRLQKYGQVRGRQGQLELDGGLSDVTTFTLAQGLSWAMPNGNTRTETGNRGLDRQARRGRQDTPARFPARQPVRLTATGVGAHTLRQNLSVGLTRQK